MKYNCDLFCRLFGLLFVLILFAGSASATQVIASNIDRLSNFSEHTSHSAGWTASGLKITLTDELNGTINYAYQAKDTSDEITYFELRKDGVAIEDYYATDSPTYSWRNGSLTSQVYPVGTVFEVYAQNYYDPSGGGALKNLSLKFDYIDSIDFISPSTNNSRIAVNYTNINVSISAPNGLKTLTYNWNGTNYTIKNSSLLLGLGFNNYSAIGENATYVVDYSQYGNNCTLEGGATTNNTGKYNGSVYFSSNVGKDVNCGTSQTLTGMANFYFSVWVKWEAGAGRAGTIISNWVGGTPAVGTLLLRYRGDQANANMTVILANSSGQTNAFSAFKKPTSFEDSNWHFVELQYNGSYITLWIDQIFQDETIFSGGLNTSTAVYQIGNSPHSSGTNNWVGNIDEVFLYNRSFSDLERKLQYNSSFSKHTSNQWYFTTNQTGLTRNIWYPFSATFTNNTDSSFSTGNWNIKYGSKSKNKVIII